MLGTFGSFFLVLLRDPDLPHQLFKKFSSFVPLSVTLPGSMVLRLRPETIVDVPPALGMVVKDFIPSSPNIISKTPKIVSTFISPTVNWLTVTLVGGLLYLLVIYLITSLYFPPQIHLLGNMVPVLFWSMVGWFLSSSWGSNNVLLAPLIYTARHY